MSVVCLLQRDVVMFGLPAIFISGLCALKLLSGARPFYRRTTRLSVKGFARQADECDFVGDWIDRCCWAETTRANSVP